MKKFIVFIIIIVVIWSGWKYIVSPYTVERDLRATEETAHKVFEEFKKSGDVSFDIILPTYVPKSFYLHYAMAPSREGKQFNFRYLNRDTVRIEITERHVSESDIQKYLDDQKKFIRKTATLADGTTVYMLRSQIDEQSGPIPGFEAAGDITIRFGTVDYTFFIDDLRIDISNAVLGSGELLSDEELLRMANSFIEEEVGSFEATPELPEPDEVPDASQEVASPQEIPVQTEVPTNKNWVSFKIVSGIGNGKFTPIQFQDNYWRINWSWSGGNIKEEENLDLAHGIAVSGIFVCQKTSLKIDCPLLTQSFHQCPEGCSGVPSTLVSQFQGEVYVQIFAEDNVSWTAELEYSE